MKYKPITNTYVFKQFQGNIINVIQETLTKSDILSETELQEQLVMINKYIKSGLKIKVLKEFEENKIRLLYANDGIPKMSSLPFIMTVAGSDINANVIVSTFGSRRQDGVVNIEYRKLYVLMESAYIAKKVLTNYNQYKNNSNIINSCIMYANMFVKPLNRKFNIHLDRNKENTALFLAAKFFLKNVLEMSNEEIIFNTASKACKAPNPLLLREADVTIPDEAYKDLGTFLNALKEDKLRIGLSNLTGRGYLESFISQYGGATIFALEMLPYWLFVINASISSMGIVNNFALEDITEKDGPKLISKFL